MKKEKESITIFEDLYDGFSRYSKDFKCAYSIPEDCGCYRLRDECTCLELKGGESLIHELVLPSSFKSFHVDSIYCLPYLRKITAYCEFDFVSEYHPITLDTVNYWRETRIEEICVLPWLVEKYKKIFGYRPGISKEVVKVSAIPKDIAIQFVNKHSNGLTTNKNGKTLVKVDNDVKVLEIPVEIERVASTAFDENNRLEKIVIMGNCEDYNKNRSSLDFGKEAVNSLKSVETLVFQGPMYTHFYDDVTEGAKMPNLKEIIYPLWNYEHCCMRGREAERVSKHSYEIKAENNSSIELVEEDGIVYTKNGKFLVSGVDCKLKSIRIKDGVEEIFEYAFCCNLAVEEVYIPRSVTKVGSNAFKSCSNIKKVIFNFKSVPENIEHAFFTYSHNIDFYLPDTFLSNEIRHQYEKLHSQFRSLGLGALTEKYVKDNSMKVVVHTLPYYVGEVSIDEETSMIYDEKGETFVGVLKEQAKNIINLSLPNHIKDVSESAFYNLSAVEKIVVPSGFDVVHIYELAKKCSKLKTIVAGEEQIMTEDGIVYSRDYKEIILVSSAVRLPCFVCKKGVEVISPHAFEDHKEMGKVQLPNTIKTIGERAFANTGLTEISMPASLQKLGKEVFHSCPLLLVAFDGQVPEGADAFNGAGFTPSASIKVQKEYKDGFVKMYTSLKHLIKTPLPKWLSWLS